MTKKKLNKKITLHRVCGVYIIKNKINSKFYIGSTKNIGARWQGHKYLLRHKTHHSRDMQDLFNEHGLGVFELSILETCEKDVLKQREQYYLDSMDAVGNGFNQCSSSQSKIGLGVRPETAKRISEGLKGHSVSPETIAKRKETLLLRYGLKEIKSYVCKGIRSEETREKMSLAKKGKKQTPEHIENNRLSRLSNRLEKNITAL